MTRPCAGLQSASRWTVRLLAGALVLAPVLMLSSCTTTSESTAPKPRTAPVTPTTAVPNRMLIGVASRPTDTDGNGYPDLIMVTAHLFAEPHPMPVHEPGVFVFDLYEAGALNVPDSQPVARWEISGEQLDAARTQSLAGPMYSFRLSLLETGGDRYPLVGVDLVARFMPDAQPTRVVRPGGSISLQIGREGPRRSSGG